MSTEPYKRNPHWIIRNKHTNSIYGTVHLSLEEAKADYDFHELQDKDWSIERM